MSLPITVDSSSQEIQVDQSYFTSLDSAQKEDLQRNVDQLNSLSQFMAGLNAPVPPPPNNITQQVSLQVQKLHKSGTDALRANKPQDAVKLLSLAVEVALKRPTWEATRFMIEEVCNCLAPRADAYMKLNQWPEAYTDSALLALLRPMDAKSHYRKGRCLQVVHKYGEAKAAFATGLATNPQDGELKAAMVEINELLGNAKA